jgi:hypothetical protein
MRGRSKSSAVHDSLAGTASFRVTQAGVEQLRRQMGDFSATITNVELPLAASGGGGASAGDDDDPLRLTGTVALQKGANPVFIIGMSAPSSVVSEPLAVNKKSSLPPYRSTAVGGV